MKYYIITYGCQMNKSDSERIAMVLERKGYLPALKINEANLIVVNMCSVRQSAVDRVYGLSKKLAKFKTQNSKSKTILTGCVLEKDKKKFSKIFDFILNIKNLPNWSKNFKAKTDVKLKPWQQFYGNCEYLKIQPKYQNDFLAFIPISTGCNFACSYCVVPFTRGSLICRDHQEILEEVKNVIEKSFKEIWLLGQNVNRYLSKSKTKDQRPKIINFPRLLKMVNNIPGDFWIRFTSPNPADFSDETIETMAKCQKVTPYLNLPLQSGDNEILKKMKRSYTIEQYKNLVKKIRLAFKKYRKGLEKEVAISTDIIVGFPGETKKQFEKTVKLFKEIKFDMAYIAKYSPRVGTAVFQLKDGVSFQEKERRYKILTKTLKEIALEKNKQYLGKEVEVLVNEEKNGFLMGKTRHYKTVKFEGKKNLISQFVKVKINQALAWGLKGKLL